MVDAPWQSYAVNYQDFFNYGMDMRGWKEYAKRIQLHRMESAMQRKIQTFSTPQVPACSLPMRAVCLRHAAPQNGSHAQACSTRTCRCTRADMAWHAPGAPSTADAALAGLPEAAQKV